MMHLVKLELKKASLRGYVYGALIAYAAIAAFLLLLYFFEGSESSSPAFRNQLEILTVVNTMVCATFIIYASALLSKLIIGEFKDKTMSLLFAYPVSRKQLIFAKLSIVFAWCFANIVLGNLLLDALLLTVNSYAGQVGGELATSDLLRHVGFVLLQGVGAAGMSLLPLLVGLPRRSVAATIVASIFIVSIVNSNNGGFSLSSIVAIPLSLAAIGILGSYLSFRNIDRADAA
ncbi:ABC transporter permease [Saccharibacillus alkalitolerans]|uniref:ABC transporter permease subunit n=1 Tax=Saccharibacillus alkalitolerans TaxID=2705290 RepID=A0ABX0F682_9BACL|nr:ABC transporter permease [Saccharibacillus alkalitolerans]NGZ76463.1 ABC transporter permease subunit [Saccharibacillus alkalitolerans]